MDDNTFQEQLDIYFGGTTGSSLGPDITSSSLQETKADRWKVGYTPATQFRGVDMGATPAASNTAFLDFNSLNGGTADYDTRFVSVGGEAGINGRGTLSIVGNRFDFVGNTPNPAPYVQMPNGIQFIGGIDQYHPPTNQGRLHSVRQVSWSGNLAPSGIVPALVVYLQDIDTGVPLTGQFTVTISNGYSGTGASMYYSSFAICRSAVGNPYNWELAFEKGTGSPTDLDALPFTAASIPQIFLYNKSADPAKYLITGTVFYDTAF